MGEYEWSKVNFLSEKILAEFQDLEKEFEKILPVFKGQKMIAENFLSRVKATMQILKNFFGNDGDFFRFVELKREDILLGYIDKAKISQVKDQLRNASAKLIFVDQNLTVNRSFESWNYFYDLSLKQFKTQDLGKSGQEKIPIKVFRNLGYFSHPSKLEEYKKILADFIEGTKKDLLVVSNSFNATQKFYSLFKEFLEVGGYSVFAQGISGGRPKITEKIKENPRNIIIGTLKFLRGVEINPVDRLLILHLPFQSPEDPLVQVEEVSERIFGKVILPQAILRFKDILGFVLRDFDVSQKGSKLHLKPAVMVWDQKLADGRYAKDFEDSLPDCFKLEIF